MEHAAMALRVKALTDGAIIPFGERVAIRLMGPKTNWHARGTTGQLLKLDTHTRASWVLTEQGEIAKGTAPVKITQLNPRLGEDNKHGPWQKVVAPTGQPFWLHETLKVTQWREPQAVELPGDQPMVLRAQPTGDFSAAVTLGKPTSVEQQVVVKSHGDERKRWIKAITDEIESLRKTNTMRPATPEEAREFRSKEDPVAPSKMVFVIKPKSTRQDLLSAETFFPTWP